MTEASKVDEATRVANKIVKLKDNPVPSILVTFDKIKECGLYENPDYFRSNPYLLYDYRGTSVLGPNLKCKFYKTV